MPFKIGDRVRFKSDQGWRLEQNPDTYVVVHTIPQLFPNDPYQLISFKNKNENSNFFFWDRFELVTPKKIEDDLEYKELFI